MIKSWWEIKILCDPQLEELIFWNLQKYGFSGTVTEVKGEFLLLRAYQLESEISPLDLGAIAKWLEEYAFIEGCSPPITAWELLPDQDWQEAWKQHWKSQLIGDRFLVCPAWLTPQSIENRIVLRLDPGAAFGTGDHPTTQLCIESLEMHFFSRPTKETVIVDIGCGSGILGIASILLGATRVYAVDLDPLAVESAKENCDLNKITPEQMIITKGSVSNLAKLTETKVDGVICNILADVIIELIPRITDLAKSETWGIFSGIVLEQIEPVAHTLEEYGWNVSTIWKRGQWCCLNVRRQE